MSISLSRQCMPIWHYAASLISITIYGLHISIHTLWGGSRRIAHQVWLKGINLSLAASSLYYTTKMATSKGLAIHTFKLLRIGLSMKVRSCRSSICPKTPGWFKVILLTNICKCSSSVKALSWSWLQLVNEEWCLERECCSTHETSLGGYLWCFKTHWAALMESSLRLAWRARLKHRNITRQTKCFWPLGVRLLKRATLPLQTFPKPCRLFQWGRGSWLLAVRRSWWKSPKCLIRSSVEYQWWILYSWICRPSSVNLTQVKNNKSSDKKSLKAQLNWLVWKHIISWGSITLVHNEG